VILVELSPVAAAPPAPPNEVAPGPVQSQAEQQPTPDKPVEEAKVEPEPEQAPVPEPKIEIPPAPVPEPLAVLPPPKPKHVEKKKPRERHANLASAPSPAEQRAERAVAPAPGAVSRNSNAVLNWKSALVARLERYKRYPAEARGEHGTVQVAFSVDRHGAVHHPRVLRSSGSSLLDRDALAWLARAQPLPAPPPEVAGALIPIAVPLRYNAR
jgi:periplasmic protein TonB